jgi:hypothetical protein
MSALRSVLPCPSNCPRSRTSPRDKNGPQSVFDTSRVLQMALQILHDVALGSAMQRCEKNPLSTGFLATCRSRTDRDRGWPELSPYLYAL